MEPDSELRAMLARYTGAEPGHPWEQTKRDVNRLAQRLQMVLGGFKAAADDAGEIEVELAEEINEVDRAAEALLDLLLTSGWYETQSAYARDRFDALATCVGWKQPDQRT